MFPGIEKRLLDRKDRMKGYNGYHDDEKVICDGLGFGSEARRDKPDHRTAE